MNILMYVHIYSTSKQFDYTFIINCLFFIISYIVNSHWSNKKNNYEIKQMELCENMFSIFDPSK